MWFSSLRRSHTALALSAVLSSLVLCGSLARADDNGPPPPGHAVLARPTGDALIIVDLSETVAYIVANKLSDQAANGLIERDAASVLAAKLPSVDRGAKSITVRVIYQRTGAVSPMYGTATFAGVEKYATLKPDKGAPADRKALAEQLKGDPLPAWLVFTITGALPPHT